MDNKLYSVLIFGVSTQELQVEAYYLPFLFRATLKEITRVASKQITDRVIQSESGTYGTTVVSHLDYNIMIRRFPGNPGKTVVVSYKSFNEKILNQLLYVLYVGLEKETDKLAYINRFVKDAETPAKLLKLVEINQTLEETREILMTTVEKLLTREEKLSDLILKTEDLSEDSKRFYRGAEKLNDRCCIIL